MGYSSDWPMCTDGDVAQMVERSLSMWEVGGSIPPVSSTLLLLGTLHLLFLLRNKKVFASSGNRTRAARVAGEHSTTEPTMLVDFVAMQQCSSCGRVVKATDSKSVSLWERRFESYQLRQSLFGCHWLRHNYQFIRFLRSIDEKIGFQQIYYEIPALYNKNTKIQVVGCLLGKL